MDSNEVDFLRALINYLDSKVNQSEETGTVDDNSADSSATIDPDAVVSPIDADQPDRFIPPLQAKIEMMKKMTGVEQKGKDPIPQPQGDQTIGSDAPAQQPQRVTIASVLHAFDDEDDGMFGA
jgi:hypothetical protein